MEKYEYLEFTIIEFDEVDVITASGDQDDDGDTYLPIVP